ncbi:MAG: NAD(P)/FAD-dependent oxidoreductase [Gemmatimonadales bacterium]
MRLISGRPFWPDHSGAVPRYPPLREHAACEVAVIGGGYSGALMAYVLTAAGMDVLLVDQRDIGMGSTAASTALIEYQLDAELREFIELAGRARAVRSYRLSRDAVWELERVVEGLDDQSDWQRRLGLHLAAAPSAVPGLKEEAAARTRHGFEVEFLSSRALGRRFGVHAPGGLLYPDAAVVNPFRLTHALVRTARRAGLRVFARTRIARVGARRGRAVLRTERGFRIDARRVVVAGGYESLTYLPRGLTKLVSTFALVTQPVADAPLGLRRCLFTETADPYLYARSTADGRVMIGGEDEDFTHPATRTRHLPAKTRTLLRKFRRWFPEVSLSVSRAWAGTFAATADGLGYLDSTPRYRNAIFAIGVGGNGMISSVIAARLVLDRFLGKRTPDAALFRFDRPGSRFR